MMADHSELTHKHRARAVTESGRKLNRCQGEGGREGGKKERIETRTDEKTRQEGHIV